MTIPSSWPRGRSRFRGTRRGAGQSGRYFLYGEPVKVQMMDMNVTYEGMILKAKKSFFSKDQGLMRPHIRAFVDRATTYIACPDCAVPGYPRRPARRFTSHYVDQSVGFRHRPPLTGRAGACATGSLPLTAHPHQCRRSRLGQRRLGLPTARTGILLSRMCFLNSRSRSTPPHSWWIPIPPHTHTTHLRRPFSEV